MVQIVALVQFISKLTKLYAFNMHSCLSASHTSGKWLTKLKNVYNWCLNEVDKMISIFKGITFLK